MLQNEKLFESISSFHTFHDGIQPDFIGTTTLIGLRKEEKVRSDEKLEALRSAYEDPYKHLFEMMEQEETEYFKK